MPSRASNSAEAEAAVRTGINRLEQIPRLGHYLVEKRNDFGGDTFRYD